MKIVKVENINNIDVDYNLCNKLFNKDKNEISLKAWSLLNILLKKENIDLCEEKIIFNDFGKPYLLKKNIYFNISHSRSLIAIIISDKECGIDIQYVDKNKNHNKYIDKILTSNEIKIYNEIEDKNLYFYKQWSKKEAYYKYVGTGIEIKKLKNNIEKTIITEEVIYNDEKYVLSYL